MAYPNWPLAYEFVSYYLLEAKSTAVKEINILLRRPKASTKKPAPQTYNNEDVVKQKKEYVEKTFPPDSYNYKGEPPEKPNYFVWIISLAWIFYMMWMFDVFD